VFINFKQAREKARLKSEIEEVQAGVVEPVRINPTEQRNSIILLGLGGTGKTSLIRRIFQQPDATPERKTEEYRIYRCMHSVNKQNYNFFISDYVGQNLGNLVGSFIEQQKIPYSEMTYGYVNSLVLMVDLFSPPESPGAPGPDAQPTPNQARVDLQLSQWNETAIDAIFGMLTVPELSYVCLFINKFDLVSEHTRESRKRAEDLYKRIYGFLRLKIIGTKVELEVLVGSADSGDCVPLLLAKLMEHSVPARTSVKPRQGA
jgi:hypothetical protein